MNTWCYKDRQSFPSKALCCGSKLLTQGATTTSMSRNMQDKRRQEREPQLHNIPGPSGMATTATVWFKEHRWMPAAGFRAAIQLKNQLVHPWPCALSECTLPQTLTTWSTKMSKMSNKCSTAWYSHVKVHNWPPSYNPHTCHQYRWSQNDNKLKINLSALFPTVHFRSHLSASFNPQSI